MVADASSKRKYKLSAADAEGVRTCAFFSTLVGCKSGSTCKFVHPGETTAGSQAAAAKAAADSAPKKAAAAVVADDSDEVVAPVKKNKKAKAAAAAAAAAAEADAEAAEEPAPTAKKAKKTKAAAVEVPEAASPAAAAPKKAKKAAAATDTEVAAADDSAAAADGGSSKKICVFFKKGTCRSGAECEFAHIKGATRGPSKNSETGRAAAAEKAAAKPLKPAAAATKAAAAAAAPAAKAAAVKAAAVPAKPAAKKAAVAAAAAVPAAKAAKTPKKAVVAPPPAAVQVDSDDDDAAESEEEAAPAPVRKTRAAVAAALKPAAVKPVAPAAVAAAVAAAKTPKRKAAALATPAVKAEYELDDPFGLNEEAQQQQQQQQPSAKKLRTAELKVPKPTAEVQPFAAAATAAAAAFAKPTQQPSRASRSAVKPEPRAPPNTPAAPAVAAAAVKRSAAKPAAVVPPPAAAPLPVASVHSLLAALPISPFPASALESRATAAAKKRAAAAAAAAAPVVIPHPRAEVWADLVARTRAHPAYEQLYGFPTDESWSTAAPCGPRCAGLPQVVALDCEMCMTKDTATGECNGKDLVRLSVVEGGAGATVLDTLVRPSNPVIEMRSSIHGVTPRILEGVAFDAGHAQTAMAALCCPCTVMVGHALHNDLIALKMAHSAVVDTALLYGVEGAPPNATPGLRDCAKSVLDKDIQDGAHDSVTDAVTALEVAKFALGKTELPLITRGIAGPKPGREQNGHSSGKALRNVSSLLVHRLPRGVAARHLSALFSKKAMILPQAVGEPEFAEDNPHGKAIVVFPSEVHANLAFCTLKGTAKPDATGRLQKKVFLANGGYIQVRKMCTEKRSRRNGNVLRRPSSNSGASGPEAGELDEPDSDEMIDEMEVDDDLDDADIAAEDDSGDGSS